MFNLDQSIVEWRQQMGAGGIKSPQVLDELESHLREDVEQQMGSGASAQQAFKAAARRIGEAHALQTEFAKTDEAVQAPWWKREHRRLNLFGWGLGGAGLAVFWSLFGSVLDRVWARPAERTLVLVVMVLGLLGYFGSSRFFKFLPGISHKRVLWGVQVACGLLGSILSLLGMVYLMSPALVAIGFISSGEAASLGATAPSLAAWSICFFLGLASLSICFGLDEAARRRTGTVGS